MIHKQNTRCDLASHPIVRTIRVLTPRRASTGIMLFITAFAYCALDAQNPPTGLANPKLNVNRQRTQRIGARQSQTYELPASVGQFLIITIKSDVSLEIKMSGARIGRLVVPPNTDQQLHLILLREPNTIELSSDAPGAYTLLITAVRSPTDEDQALVELEAASMPGRFRSTPGFEKALAYFEQVGDQRRALQMLSGLAKLEESMKQYHLATGYYQRYLARLKGSDSADTYVSAPNSLETLTANDRLELETTSGQARTYHLPVSIGQFFTIRIQASTLLSVSMPGATMAQFLLPGGSDQLLHLILWSPQNTIQLSADVPLAKVSLLITDIRTPTDEDQAVAQLEAATSPYGLHDIPEFRKAAVYFEKVKDEPHYVQLLFNLAVAEDEYAGTFRQSAITHYESYITALNSLPAVDQSHLGKGTWREVRAIQRLDELRHNPRAFFPAPNNRAESLVVAFMNFAEDHRTAGQIPEAIADLTIAYAELPPSESGQRYHMEIALRLGELDFARFEFEGALQYFQEARSLAQNLHATSFEADAASLSGVVYFLFGERKEAMESWATARSIYHAENLIWTEANLLSSMGCLSAAGGEIQSAKQLLGDAIKLFAEASDSVSEATTLLLLGTLDLQEQRYDDALRICTRVFDLSSSDSASMWGPVPLTLMRGGALSCKGAIHHLAEHDLDQALREYKDALSAFQSVNLLDAQVSSLSSIARAEADLHDVKKASEDLDKALTLIEATGATLTAPQGRMNYFSQKDSIYNQYIQLLMERSRMEPASGFDFRALTVSEQGRARLFLESLREARANILKGIKPDLLNARKSIEAGLAAVTERKLLRRAPPASDEGMAEERELRQLELQFQIIESQIRASNPEYAALTRFSPLAREEMLGLLPKDTSLLEYYLGSPKSYLWSLSSEGLTSYTLPDIQDIRRLSRQFSDSLTAQIAQRNRPAMSAPSTDEPTILASKALSKVLLPPGSISGSKKLLIVADDALHAVPFAALSESDANSKLYKPLLENHEIVMLPSIAVGALINNAPRGNNPPAKSLAIFADPVFDALDQRVHRLGETAPPTVRSETARLTRAIREAGLTDNGIRLPRLLFTRMEADEISKVAGPSLQMKALDFDASLENVTAPGLAEYKIIHFATHALLNDEHPELSGLVFSLVDAAGRPRNGFLKLQDIYNLDLRADLVVLSACSTARGKELRGEGMVSLVRGFMYAGVNRVLASLWDVDDYATSELMREFYRSMLVEKLTPSAALRKAQLAMLRSTALSSPRYWAPFILQGDWRE
jgi:CHAT domain-containing protein/tetratricopeptide (TPR) repeat protein